MTVFTTDQQNTIDLFTAFLLDPNKSEFIIDGRPGCGKTFLIKPLINAAESISSLLTSLLGTDNALTFYLTATTNKAAEVLQEKTQMEAKTIHSFLGLRVFNDFSNGKTKLSATNAWQVYKNSIVFVDEMSMADSELLKEIRKATINCKIVYILDQNQVLPVFEPDVPLLRDGVLPDASLRQIVRQAAGNPLIAYAHALCDAIQNKTPIPPVLSCPEIQHLDAVTFRNTIDHYFTNDPDAEHKYRILAWTNKRVRQYNDYVRGLKYPSKMIEQGEFLIANDSYTGTNDAVTIRNQSEVYVCKSAPIQKQDETEIEYQLLQVRTDKNTYWVKRPINYAHVDQWLKHYSYKKEWHKYYALKNEMVDLRPVYSSTVHKSQGSTYDTVFIDLDDICSNNKIEEVRRILLVAFTRASYKVYLRGQIPSKYL